MPSSLRADSHKKFLDTNQVFKTFSEVFVIQGHTSVCPLGGGNS